jgi:hypothetical protein
MLVGVATLWRDVCAYVQRQLEVGCKNGCLARLQPLYNSDGFRCSTCVMLLHLDVCVFIWLLWNVEICHEVGR